MIPTHPPILVVENDPDHAQLFRMAFSEVGVDHPLRVSATAEDALAYLAGTAPYEDRMRNPLPDLVLSDVRLPGLGGFQVVEWLKGHPELSEVPAFLVTASPQDGDVQRAYEVGAEGYLVKPSSFPGFVAMVRSIVQSGLAPVEREPFSPFWLQLGPQARDVASRALRHFAT